MSSKTAASICAAILVLSTTAASAAAIPEPTPPVRVQPAIQTPGVDATKVYKPQPVKGYMDFNCAGSWWNMTGLELMHCLLHRQK